MIFNCLVINPPGEVFFLTSWFVSRFNLKTSSSVVFPEGSFSLQEMNKLFSDVEFVIPM